MITPEQFVEQLIEDIAQNKLEIPTLPEVALRVRKLIDDPNVNASQVAKVISTDAALSTRMMQVANSVMFTGMTQVDNVRAAVNRLGLAIVRNMVVAIATKALYSPKLPAFAKARMQELWKHSTKVAALSHALAKRYKHLRPDEAMLGGLIHDIGSLPIIIRAAKYPELGQDPAVLQKIVDRLHGDVGRLILQAWHLPDDLVAVAAEHEDLLRISLGAVDYVDVVMVANLHSYLGTKHHLARVDWTTVPVFNKMALSPDESIKLFREAQAEINGVYDLLGGKA